MRFSVTDIHGEVRELKQRGVQFEQYEFPGFDKATSIAWVVDYSAAWFTDSEATCSRSSSCPSAPLTDPISNRFPNGRHNMTATYLGSGDPARRRTDDFPVWLNDLSDDVTLEASAINGAAQGPDAVRSIILAVKSLYESRTSTSQATTATRTSSRTTRRRSRATPSAS